MDMQDNGYAIYCPQKNSYYTGLGWNEQLRTAKIYHKLSMAQNVFEKYPELKLEIYKVEIQIALPIPVTSSEENR